MPLTPRLPDGSLANQHEELIRETLPVTGHRFWTLGQGGIYFVDARETPAVLKFVDLASRKVTVVATLPQATGKVHKRSFDLARRALRVVLRGRRGSVRNPRGGEFPLAGTRPE